MRRITLLLLPVLTLAACQDQLPTSADASGAAVAGMAADLEFDLKVNLAEATTVTLYVPSESRVPLATTTLVNAETDVSTGLMHTFAADCETHFQDVTGDGDDDLILHFSVGVLFGDYDVANLPNETQTLDLTVEFEGADPFTSSYEALLVYNEANGQQHGRQNGR
jgi:hypothetical protein